MTKLNDTQRVILASAAGRPDLRVLPLPALRAPMVAVRRTIASLVKEGLLEEVPASDGDEIWRTDDDGQRLTLVLTDSGLTAMSLGPGAAKATTGPARRKTGGKAGRPALPAPGATSARRGRKTGHPETKQAIVVRMLRNGGASIAELSKATGWQEHSVRGVLTATIKKRLNLPLVSAKGEDGVRRYHIAVLRGDPATE